MFANGSANAIADRAPLTFYVTADDELVFLEPAAGAQTWSEVVERQTRREQARNAAKQTPAWARR